jgi:hypothetical protein
VLELRIRSAIDLRKVLAIYVHLSGASICKQAAFLGELLGLKRLAHVADMLIRALQASVGARKKAKRGDDPIYKKPLPKSPVKPLVGLASRLCGKDKVRVSEEPVFGLGARTGAADWHAMLRARQSDVVSVVLARMNCREKPRARPVTPRRQREATAVQTHQLSSLQLRKPRLQRRRRYTPARRMATRQLRAHRTGTSTP